MPDPIQSGQDVSDLMNLKSGTDVTSLMSGTDVTDLINQSQPEEKGLLSTAYEKLMTPLLGEMESGKPSLLSSGIDVGANVPLLNKIWPGGIHIPGAAEVYNELIRPMSAPIGIGMMGLEGAINRFSPNFRGSPSAEIEPEAIKTAETVSPAIKPTPKLLNAAPPEVTNPPRFIAGRAGVAENKLYPIDTGPVNPHLGATDQGTVLPRELGEVTKLSPDYVANEGLSLGRPENISGGSDFNTGKLNEPYQLPSATKAGRVKPEAPIFLDEAKQAEPPKTIEDEVLPPPGSIKTFRDVNPILGAVSSIDQTLSSREISKPIADTLITAQDTKDNWRGTTHRELSKFSDDISTPFSKRDENSRILLGMLVDGKTVGDLPKARLDNSTLGILELQQRAEDARVILDQVHDMFPEGATRSGGDVGYLENYFTHIQHQPTDIRSAISDILDHHFGIFKRGEEIPIPETEGKEGVGDIYNKSTGHPSSPFVEERTNAIKDVEYDVNKVFPAYIESAAKVIFDKPAVEKATALLKNIPDSRLKKLATAAIQNYSRYDASGELHQAWDQWTKSVARTTARSLLGFNTGLQTLHLARIPANLWPELGTRYTMIGLKHIANNPVAAWTEAAKLGLLQNEIKPFNFKTSLEKMDSISNFLSMADYIDKAAGYHGYKQKFLDQGIPEPQAKLMALRETKRVSQTSDPARAIPALTAPAGGNPIGIAAVNLGGLFKTVPAKIVEQYTRIAANTMNNPKAAARMMAGVGLALAANEGLKTFHLNPMNMIPTTIWGPFGDAVKNVSRLLFIKHDIPGALKETMLWATPGGKSLQRQIEKGPSALQ